MQVIYLNVKDNAAPEIREIPDNLDTFHQLLQCTTIDIPMRRIGKRYFRVICDDEGLLKDSPKISAISNLGKVRLVGNLIIVSNDVTPDGDLIGLTNEESEYIKNLIQKVYTQNYPNGYYILTQCECY